MPGREPVTQATGYDGSEECGEAGRLPQARVLHRQHGSCSVVSRPGVSPSSAPDTERTHIPPAEFRVTTPPCESSSFTVADEDTSAHTRLPSVWFRGVPLAAGSTLIYSGNVRGGGRRRDTRTLLHQTHIQETDSQKGHPPVAEDHSEQ